MARRRADVDDLSAHVLPWAREHRVSEGPLATMLTELAERLLSVNEHNIVPPKPTEGIVVRGHWWQHPPKGFAGMEMAWRAVWLHDHSVILEEREAHGSRNISEYAAIMETLQHIDEHGLEAQVKAVYSASYVAVRWITRRQFNTSQRCPLWIEQAAATFSVTDYPRHLVKYWDPEVWGGTPADYPGYDYLMKWNVR
jgi:hypothetical protein